MGTVLFYFHFFLPLFPGCRIKSGMTTNGVTAKRPSDIVAINVDGFVKSSRCKAREALEVRRIFSRVTFRLYAATPQG
jgi:hypothetical protein